MDAATDRVFYSVAELMEEYAYNNLQSYSEVLQAFSLDFSLYLQMLRPDSLNNIMLCRW